MNSNATIKLDANFLKLTAPKTFQQAKALLEEYAISDSQYWPYAIALYEEQAKVRLSDGRTIKPQPAYEWLTAFQRLKLGYEGITKYNDAINALKVLDR